MNDEQKAVSMAMITGIIGGFLSNYTKSALGLGAGIVFLVLLNKIQKMIFKGKKEGWSGGNIIVPYIFTWIMFWIILVNL